MKESLTGSLILKAITNPDAEECVVLYLQRYVKNIRAEKVPELLQRLPVVLASNVDESTARKVLAELRHLSVDIVFIPAFEQKGEAIQEQEGATKASVEVKEEPEPGETSYVGGAAGQIGFDRRFLTGLVARYKELLIIFGMVTIAWMLNYTLASQYLLLGFYTLPAVMAAYCFGRRQAVFTAFASILLVVIVLLINPDRFDASGHVGLGGSKQWYHLFSWGSILLVTVYAMGTLYEKHQEKIRELRRTYQALLLILRHFISLDGKAEDHCFRVSIYAAKIAATLRLSEDVIEDIRSAAMYHDIGSLEINREVLQKVSYLATGEHEKEDTALSEESLGEAMNGPLGRVLPLMLGQYEAPAGHNPSADKAQVPPIGAHILAVADKFDTLVNGPSIQKSLSRQQVKEIIINGSGTDFHPKVVEAFVKAFDKGEMKIPNILE